MYAWYDPVGHFEPHEYVSDTIVSQSKTKQGLKYSLANKRMNSHDDLLDKGPYIRRYRVNDVMPTMSMNDYDINLHKKRHDEVVEHLAQLPGSKGNKSFTLERARHNPYVTFNASDSSNSEDESRWKGITDKSLMHPIPLALPKIPTRQLTSVPPPFASKKRVQKQKQWDPRGPKRQSNRLAQKAQSKKRVKQQPENPRRSKRLKSSLK